MNRTARVSGTPPVGEERGQPGAGLGGLGRSQPRAGRGRRAKLPGERQDEGRVVADDLVERVLDELVRPGPRMSGPERA
jgi:hypothetical protein